LQGFRQGRLWAALLRGTKRVRARACAADLFLCWDAVLGAELVDVEVPTWNFLAAHLSGVPEILSPEENSAVLHRLVEHFERRVAHPRPLDGTPADAENARSVMRGTVGMRLTPTRIVAKRKMSQNLAPEVVTAVIEELEGDGPYASPTLAREMRLANDDR
jgi:transcriptional regulator